MLDIIGRKLEVGDYVQDEDGDIFIIREINVSGRVWAQPLAKQWPNCSWSLVVDKLSKLTEEEVTFAILKQK